MRSFNVLADNSPGYVREVAAFARWIYDYMRPTITQVTGDYELAIPNEFVIIDASLNDVDISLPQAKGFNREAVTLIRIDASGFNVNLIAQPGEMVNGLASIPIAGGYTRIKILSTGVQWLSA